jgi:hypothetical protein
MVDGDVRQTCELATRGLVPAAIEIARPGHHDEPVRLGLEPAREGERAEGREATDDAVHARRQVRPPERLGRDASEDQWHGLPRGLPVPEHEGEGRRAEDEDRIKLCVPVLACQFLGEGCVLVRTRKALLVTILREELIAGLQMRVEDGPHPRAHLGVGQERAMRGIDHQKLHMLGSARRCAAQTGEQREEWAQRETPSRRCR